MKHIKEFKINEDFIQITSDDDFEKTYLNKSDKLTFDQLLQNPTFIDIYSNLMDTDSFEWFKDLGKTGDLTYEVSHGTINVYFTDASKANSLFLIGKALGAEEVSLENDHVRWWFD